MTERVTSVLSETLAICKLKLPQLAVDHAIKGAKASREPPYISALIIFSRAVSGRRTPCGGRPLKLRATARRRCVLQAGEHAETGASSEQGYLKKDHRRYVEENKNSLEKG